MIMLLRTLWSALDRFAPPPPTAVDRVPASFVVGPDGAVAAPVPFVRREPCVSCTGWRDQLDSANDYIELLCALLREHGIRVEVHFDAPAATS